MLHSKNERTNQKEEEEESERNSKKLKIFIKEEEEVQKEVQEQRVEEDGSLEMMVGPLEILAELSRVGDGSGSVGGGVGIASVVGIASGVERERMVERENTIEISNTRSQQQVQQSSAYRVAGFSDDYEDDLDDSVFGDRNQRPLTNNNNNGFDIEELSDTMSVSSSTKQELYAQSRFRYQQQQQQQQYPQNSTNTIYSRLLQLSQPSSPGSFSPIQVRRFEFWNKGKQSAYTTPLITLPSLPLALLFIAIQIDPCPIFRELVARECPRVPLVSMDSVVLRDLLRKRDAFVEEGGAGIVWRVYAMDVCYGVKDMLQMCYAQANASME